MKALVLNTDGENAALGNSAKLPTPRVWRTRRAPAGPRLAAVCHHDVAVVEGHIAARRETRSRAGGPNEVSGIVVDVGHAGNGRFQPGDKVVCRPHRPLRQVRSPARPGKSTACPARSRLRACARRRASPSSSACRKTGRRATAPTPIDIVQASLLACPYRRPRSNALEDAAALRHGENRSGSGRRRRGLALISYRRRRRSARMSLAVNHIPPTRLTCLNH